MPPDVDPKHRPEFDALARHLRTLVGSSRFYYIPNPGNWGDALIRGGTERFFEHYGFRYWLFRKRSLSKNIFRHPSMIPLILRGRLGGALIVYGGNGGFCRHYHMEVVVKKLASVVPSILVLPSTFEYPCDFGQGCRIYVRDVFQSHEMMPEAPFCHDMAFFLGKVKREIKESEGFFFRQDHETAGKVVPPDGNLDISALGNESSDVNKFFDQVGRFQVIHTDRLHVGIAGALLGREVHLHANSYFKTEAIYRSSIRDVFPNVCFHP